MPNIIYHAVATSSQASNSSNLPTDDTDNASEYYISESNWESFYELRSRKSKDKIEACLHGARRNGHRM